MSILTYQPIKAVYAISALAFETLRLPLWLIKYALRFGRQTSSYSFRQALGVRIVYSFVAHSAAVHVRTPLPHTPGREKERFVLIQPFATQLYTGPLRSNSAVQPAELGATWYPALLTAASKTDNVLVVLHMHGGAFVIGDGRTEASGFFADKIFKHTPATHILKPQYRLSTLPVGDDKKSNPFPAAIQDMLTAYLYLIKELQVPANRIVISGDSAGGNATLALLRYLAEFGDTVGLPQPGAAWLWSPWLEIKNAIYPSAVTSSPNYWTDYLSPGLTTWGANAYAGRRGPKVLDDPYVSGLKHPFKTSVPIWINTGGKEVLLADDCELAERMREMGNRVELDVEQNAPHDIMLLGNLLGFNEEARKCAERAGGWLSGVIN